MIKETLIVCEDGFITIENMFTEKITMVIVKKKPITVNYFVNIIENCLRTPNCPTQMLIYDFYDIYSISIFSSLYYIFRYYINGGKLRTQEELALDPHCDKLFKYNLIEKVLRL